MKQKKVNATLLILCSLIFLSFAFFVAAQNASNGTSNVMLDSDQDGLTDQEEKLYGTDPHNPDTGHCGYTDGESVRAGYDPLTCKKIGAPISGTVAGVSTGAESTATNNSTNNQTSNLTQQMAQKISSLAEESDPSKQQLSMDEINQMASGALNAQGQTLDMPTVNKSDIKIKKQNYDKYGTDKAAQMKKDDFENYIAQIFYILASNSPKPLTSATDMTAVISQMTQQIITAMTTRDASSLESLSQSGQKILDQLKDVEVPEELVDIHIQAMQYALYAQNLKDYIKPNPTDPLSDIVNFSKISTFIQSLISFSTDVQSKLDTYNLNYSDIQKKIENYGIPAPDLSGFTSSSSTGNGSTTDSSSDTTLNSLINAAGAIGN